VLVGAALDGIDVGRVGTDVEGLPLEGESVLGLWEEGAELDGFDDDGRVEGLLEDGCEEGLLEDGVDDGREEEGCDDGLCEDGTLVGFRSVGFDDEGFEEEGTAVGVDVGRDLEDNSNILFKYVSEIYKFSS